MNIYAILSLISAVSACLLGLLVYYKSNRNWLSYTFLLFSFGLTLLNLSQFQLRISELPEEALLWSKLSGIWAIVAALSLHFTYELNREKRKSLFFYLLIYAPAAILFYINLTTNLISIAPIKQAWGWELQYNYGLFHNLAAIFGIVYWLLTLYFTFKYFLLSKGIFKKQARLIFIAYLFDFCITISTDFLFPIFKIPFPALGATADIFSLMFIGYAIWKYQLFSIGKDSFSDKLFDSISNYMLLIDSKRVILKINQKLLNLLEFDEKEITGKNIAVLLAKSQSEDINPYTAYLTLNSEFKNKTVIFKAKSGKVISLKFSVSYFPLQGQNTAGFIWVGEDENSFEKRDLNYPEINRKIDFLAEAALDIVKLKSKDAVYEFITNKTYKLLNTKAIIGCTELTGTTERHQWQIKTLQGIGEYTQRLMDLLGFDIEDLKTSSEENVFSLAQEGKLYKLDFDLGRLTNGKISTNIGEKVKLILGLKELYALPIHFGKNFFGSLHIATRKSTPEIPVELLESLMSMASVVLNRLQAEEELNKSNSIFKTIVRNSQIAIFILDLKGNFILAEGIKLHRLKIDRNALESQSIFKLYADFPHMLKQVERALNGETFKEVISLKGILYYNANFSPFHNEKGERAGVICMADDITNQVKSEKQLNELNELQNKLFKVIGHDLKSPIANILSYTNLMLNEVDSFSIADIKQFTNSIQNSAKSGYEILVDLLDWSKSVSKNSPVNLQEVCLQKQMETVIEQVTPLANKKSISLKNKINYPVVVSADKNMIIPVFRNIISNAIKFTYPEGKIEINAREDEQSTYVDIADNGMGMTENQLKNLFVFQEKSVNRGTEGESGSGLGLQISKDFMGKNGGHIEVKSTIGQGSIFTLVFPKIKGQSENRKEIEK